MRERGPNAHKERVYGWYPSQHNVYQKVPLSTTYDMEMLYKHSMSKAADRSGTSSIQPPTPVAISLQSPHPPSSQGGLSRTGFRPGSVIRTSLKTGSYTRTPSQGSRPPTVTSPILTRSVDPHLMMAATQTSPQVESRELSPSRRIKSAPPSTGHRTPASVSAERPSRPHTGKLWRTSLPATTMTPAQELDEGETQEAWVHQLRKEIEMSERKRTDRAQSAAVHRQKTSPPPRQIKSAGSKRSVLIPSYLRRPENPVPPSSIPVETTEEEQDEEVLDYDEQLEKHGWKFEVPGDPMGLKKKCLPHRPKFFSKVAVPSVAREPPKIHMETSETFFYNTIPRQPMTYTINQDWISEIIHAKRMELQKREGIQYRWKNFSFVY